jgi:RHS repeat-associated protein
VGRIYDNGSGQWKAFVLSNIFLTPNKWYRISVKARAVTNLGSKYARAYLSYNATDNEGDKQVTKLVTWSASELASGEWVRKYVIFRVPNTPNGAPYWKVRAYLYGHYGKGIIEFDDYRIEEFVTQPSGPPPETPGYEYTGKKRDSSTGLYYFGARYYDPEIGRFITEDPAKHGTNWYVYCENNPLKYVDPNGLSPQHTNSNMAEKKDIDMSAGMNSGSVEKVEESKYKSDPEMLKPEQTIVLPSPNNTPANKDTTERQSMKQRFIIWWTNIKWRTVGIGVFEIVAGVAEVKVGVAFAASTSGIGGLIAAEMVYVGVVTVGIGCADVVGGFKGCDPIATQLPPVFYNVPPVTK